MNTLHFSFCFSVYSISRSICFLFLSDTRRKKKKQKGENGKMGKEENFLVKMEQVPKPQTSLCRVRSWEPVSACSGHEFCEGRAAFLSMCVCVCVLVIQSCPILCDPMDCSPPGSSVHGSLQSRILVWVALSCSRGSSQPRYRTPVS